MKKVCVIFSMLSLIIFINCADKQEPIIGKKPVPTGSVDTVFMNRAEVIFESIFKHYWSEKAGLFYGTYPNTLGTPQEPTTGTYGAHAFLWGFGGVFSAYNTIVQHTPNTNFRLKYESRLKKSLSDYYNSTKNPQGFGCFINDHDERFYDDAIWIGIDLIELYAKTKDSWYLEYAKNVWTFIMSGKDDLLGGGIYWKETPKDTKNTCSNAPAVVLALKLYQVTKDATYLETGKELYKWVKTTLQDPTDYRYWDSKKMDGRIEDWKFSYNSGQMLQAGVLLFNATNNIQYLTDAELLAEACYKYYFEDFISQTGEQFRIIKDGHLWFNAVMVRGFIELEKIKKNPIYMIAMKKSLEYGWKYAIDPETKFLNCYLSGRKFENVSEKGDILHNGAIAELYARLAVRY